MDKKIIISIYNNNKNFKDYVDRYKKNNPEKTLDEIFEHKIIQNVAVEYEVGGCNFNNKK